MVRSFALSHVSTFHLWMFKTTGFRLLCVFVSTHDPPFNVSCRGPRHHSGYSILFLLRAPLGPFDDRNSHRSPIFLSENQASHSLHINKPQVQRSLGTRAAHQRQLIAMQMQRFSCGAMQDSESSPKDGECSRKLEFGDVLTV
jgi:hypothetical protein